MNNIFEFKGLISLEDRERLHGHKAYVVWFTGLSSSGKSTIAHQVEQILYARGCSTYVLDGDNVRQGLCKDLGFSSLDRTENVRRIGEMAKLFFDAGLIVMAAFISPYRADRNAIADIIGRNNMLEVYVECPVEVCSLRDPKGLYKRAKAGEVNNFTGISSPYEPPETPDLLLNTTQYSVMESSKLVVSELNKLGIIHEKFPDSHLASSF